MSSAPQPLVVVKLGGSVLTDDAAYVHCAQALRSQLASRPHERIAAVVSARHGMTDRLLAEATALCPEPEARALDLLWSIGEVESVARLTLCLHALGVRACGLGAHECGLLWTISDAVQRGTAAAAAVEIDPVPVRRRLRTAEVVVVPGFFARTPEGTLVSLGRGGSDLTAVLLAVGLQARTCQLVKDVPGYFDRDPNQFPDACPLAEISSAAALRMAAAGCDLVQTQALEVAGRSGLPVVVRSLDPAGRQTVVIPELRAELVA
ncbi:MAG: hypothetical protein IPM18_06480 [Phycisphaerales bacterium]|nr:hypothetical protein [Phycisphaerales bacterium]